MVSIRVQDHEEKPVKKKALRSEFSLIMMRTEKKFSTPESLFLDGRTLYE